eukprot:5890881-Pyramimonas_sp.AAC.1
MAHRLLHAAALASRLCLGHRAAPERASTSEASRSITPRITRHNIMVRSISPSSLVTSFH